MEKSEWACCGQNILKKMSEIDIYFQEIFIASRRESRSRATGLHV